MWRQKLIWSKWHLKQTTNFISFKECSTSYKSLKCKEQINSLNDTFYRWQPIDLMRHRHFSPPRDVLSRRQYCQVSERDIVYPTYLQPHARTCIASSLDFWHSRFQCFQSTLAHPNQCLHLNTPPGSMVEILFALWPCHSRKICNAHLVL